MKVYAGEFKKSYIVQNLKIILHNFLNFCKLFSDILFRKSSNNIQSEQHCNIIFSIKFAILFTKKYFKEDFLCSKV